MKIRSMGLLVLAAMATTAVAGNKLHNEVSFDQLKPFARGNLGDARNSGDATQYIGCTIFSNGAQCIAVDVNGTQHSCSTTDPALLDVAKTIHADSYVVFRWDPASGNCTTLLVTNDSRYAPK